MSKTKTAQFASGERARDWIDYLCPFNPRGDSYLEPDGSSARSAVAIAAYPWLDLALGLDTLGSMLGPSSSQGIFGIRSTQGLAAPEGIVPVSSRLDTTVFFSRSVFEALACSSQWYDILHGSFQDPLHILYPDEEFDEYHADQKTVMESFIHDLEKVGGTERRSFNIHKAWRDANPDSMGKEDRRVLRHYSSSHPAA